MYISVMVWLWCGYGYIYPQYIDVQYENVSDLCEKMK